MFPVASIWGLFFCSLFCHETNQSVRQITPSYNFAQGVGPPIFKVTIDPKKAKNKRDPPDRLGSLLINEIPNNI